MRASMREEWCFLAGRHSERQTERKEEVMWFMARTLPERP